MLKAKINGNEGIFEVKAEGTLSELMADVTTLLSIMYKGVKEEQKQDFKECIKRLVKKELESFLKDLFGDK